MNKICNQCGIEKDISQFFKDSQNKSGYRGECKVCRKLYNTSYYKINKGYILNRMSINHKNEPWLLIYKWIKDRCENPKTQNYYTYGGRGIKCLITIDEIKTLWFRDNAFEMNEPSIDREDNDGDYIFNNCRFIELSLNIRKNKIIPIIQFDLKNNLVKEWEAISDAQKIYGHTIIDCLRGKTRTSKGYIWRYKNEN